MMMRVEMKEVTSGSGDLSAEESLCTHQMFYCERVDRKCQEGAGLNPGLILQVQLFLVMSQDSCVSMVTM